MTKSNDLSRSLVALDQDSTLIAVVEMSQSSWLVSALVPGLARDPLKKLSCEPEALAALLSRWRRQAEAAGRPIARIAVAYEAGRDGFWLARWLRARGIECHVMHASSIPVARTHRRAKTDRLDCALLKRAFVGWLRGEKEHCSMVAVPDLATEDARRPGRERDRLVREQTQLINRMKAAMARLGIRDFDPGLRRAPRRLAQLRLPDGGPVPPHSLAELRREMARLALVREQIDEIEAARQEQIERAEAGTPEAGIRQLAGIHGLGLATAERLVREIFCRDLRDRRAVARAVGLTGSPDESGRQRREQGLARAGNARVRSTMIQLAWRFLYHQPDSDLARWFRARTEAIKGNRKPERKKPIVALARKLLIALWRFFNTGEVPNGVSLKPAA